MGPVSILATNLGAVCVESALWGVFFVLAVTSLALLIRRFRDRDTQGRLSRSLWQSPLFVATSVLLCTVSAHWIVLVYRLYDAFIYHEGGAAPVEYFASLRQPTEVALTALNVVSVVVCEVMVIARTWVIWNRDVRAVAFPICTTTGLVVCCVAITYQFSQNDSGEALYNSTLGRWVTAGYVLTISTNIYSTGAISYRILSTSKGLRHGIHATSGLSILTVLSIFVESAALYAAWALFFFVTYQAQASINVLANDCLPVVSGISLMLITLRIGLGWAHRGLHTGPTPDRRSSSLVTHGPVFTRTQGGSLQGGAQDVYPLRGITFSVTKSVEQETDFALPQGKAAKGSPEASVELGLGEAD